MKNFFYTLIFLGLSALSVYAQQSITLVGYSPVNTNGSKNVAIGYKAMFLNTTGFDNIAVGYHSLYSNTIGSNNSAVGTHTLENNISGEYNTALGINTLVTNTVGSRNCAIGANSLRSNTSGTYNYTLGYEAMQGNSTGCNNIAIGHQSLWTNSIGSSNSAVGNRALLNATGDMNNAFGFQALSTLTTGDENIAMGYDAGQCITTGMRNIAFGSYTFLKSTSNYNITIGYRTGGTWIGDNNIIIGKKISLPSGYTNAMNIGGVLFGSGFQSGLPEMASAVPANGRIGINVVDPTATLDVAGTAKISSTLLVSSNVGIGTTTPNAMLQIGNSLSNTGEQTVRISTPPSGIAGNIVDALHIDTYNTQDFYQGVAISMGLKHSEYGAYTSRIVHYGKTATTRASKLQLQTHSSLADVWNTGLLIDDVGNVGIGIISPNAKLEVKSTAPNTSVIQYLSSTGGFLGHIWETGDNSSMLTLADNNGTENIILASKGVSYFKNTIKIGTTATNPNDELLTVFGVIHAKEVKVDLTGSLADYVFDESYQLMPLHQVESYVKENKHLPEIPSATEAKDKGMNMGEMQNKLLQKVEELTLYVIEQQKQIEELKKQIGK